MTVNNMKNVDTSEEEIIQRLASVQNEDKNENNDKLNENEEAEFDKLHSMIPYLTSKSSSQLDIVLEAISYINMLQNKLLQNIQL